MTSDEREMVRKFELLCRMTDEYLNSMTPQEKDRMKQVHLACARGSRRNGDVLGRRLSCGIGSGGPVFQFVTAEDIILMKLVWRKDTRSAKQWENALSVARVKGARMDWGYLFKQAETLDIADDLTKLRDEAGI